MPHHMKAEKGRTAAGQRGPARHRAASEQALPQRFARSLGIVRIEQEAVDAGLACRGDVGRTVVDEERLGRIEPVAV